MKKHVLVLAAAAFSVASMSASASAVTDTAIERMCDVKASQPPVAYKVEAKRYGISTRNLKKLEQMPVCDGQRLANVKNRWMARNRD